MGVVMREYEKTVYTLSNKAIGFLLFYYTVILIGGLIFTVSIACSLSSEMDKSILLYNTFLNSVSVSSVLCSIQYIRRIYKACITERIDVENHTYKSIGYVLYFFFRPFFAAAFSIVAVFAMLSGMFVVTSNLDYILNEKFLYICTIVSAFIGYSIGSVVNKFEQIGTDRIEKFSKEGF